MKKYKELNKRDRENIRRRIRNGTKQSTIIREGKYTGAAVRECWQNRPDNPNVNKTVIHQIISRLKKEYTMEEIREELGVSNSIIEYAYAQMGTTGRKLQRKRTVTRWDKIDTQDAEVKQELIDNMQDRIKRFIKMWNRGDDIMDIARDQNITVGSARQMKVRIMINNHGVINYRRTPKKKLDPKKYKNDRSYSSRAYKLK